MKMTIEFFESLLKLDKKTQNLILKKYIKSEYNFQRSGGRLHKLDEKCKNKNLWSFSLNEDIRLMLFRDNNEFTAVYVDHHENAYNWANKKDYNWNYSKEILIEEDIDKNSYGKKTNVIKQSTESSILKNQGVSHKELIQIGLNYNEAQEIIKINNDDEFLDYINKCDNSKKEALLRLAVGDKLEVSCDDKDSHNANRQNSTLKDELISIIKNELQEFKISILEQSENISNDTEKTITTNKTIYNYIVVIEDNVLEEVIRKKIHKEDGPLYYSDIVTITKLEYIGNGIKLINDLRGIQHLENLEEINFSCNNIIDLTPLAGLKKLKTLILNSNRISNITPLKELFTLETLSLAFNNIEEISGLKDLTNIYALHLSHNKVENINVLEKLVNIVDLTMGDNEIKEVKSLKNLNKLEILDLRNNNITGIYNFENLKELFCLDLYGNKLKEFSFLKHLESLEDLMVLNNPIEDYYYIKKFNDKILSRPYGINTAVTFVDAEFVKVLRDNSIGIYLCEEDLCAIEELDASNRNIKNIEGIQFFANLKELRLGNNKIENIERLEHLHKLEVLDLRDNYINDISPLESLINLKKLGLKNNNISDISPITKIINLELLYLSQNKVQNFELLKGVSENIKKKDFTVPQLPEDDKIIKIEEYLKKEENSSTYCEYFIKGNAYSRTAVNTELPRYNLSDITWAYSESDALDGFVNRISPIVSKKDNYFEDNFFVICKVIPTGINESSYTHCKGEPLFENNEEDRGNRCTISQFIRKVMFSETETELNNYYNEFVNYTHSNKFLPETLKKMYDLYLKRFNEIQSGKVIQDDFNLSSKFIKSKEDKEKIIFYATAAIKYFKMFGNKIEEQDNKIKIVIPKINDNYYVFESAIECSNNVDIILEWENYLFLRNMKKESVLSYLGFAFEEHRKDVNKYKEIFRSHGMMLLTTKDLHDDDLWYVLTEHEQKANELLNSLNIKLPDSYDDIPVFRPSGGEGVYWAEGEETEEEFWEHED